MKTGLLERILTKHYGKATSSTEHGLPVRSWNLRNENDSATLYVGMDWDVRLGRRFSSLKAIYGDIFGGFVIGDSLRLAVMMPHEIYGLWPIDELQMQPSVQDALERDPDVDYFMDQHNVVFYGFKDGQLYVFDTADEELDSLGPIEPALENLLDEFDYVEYD